jgi:hypothetical protein
LSHRIAFPAKAGLHAHEHVAEHGTHHLDALPIGELTPRRGTPRLFDFLEVLLAAYVIVHRNAGVHIGRRAELLPIALRDTLAQFVHTRRQVHRVAGFLHLREHTLQ